ncbi:MAG: nucleoside deaminase [Candidatus Gracilibacteria bacterium]|nr:nucleoside deaminase [Candidatus Gracilibacteria bacterium]
MDHRKFIEMAIEKAQESVNLGGFPAGAVVVQNGIIVGEGISLGNKLHDPASHGELSAIRDACKNLTTSVLSDCTLYASMEPCIMCLSASMWSSIPKIIFACSKQHVSHEYYGGQYQSTEINSLFSHPLDIIHFRELEESSLSVVKNWENFGKGSII